MYASLLLRNWISLGLNMVLNRMLNQDYIRLILSFRENSAAIDLFCLAVNSQANEYGFFRFLLKAFFYRELFVFNIFNLQIPPNCV